jgi:aerobic-type carbon monoxide dehydrogenase small subunit (CoxS/CutS family)
MLTVDGRVVPLEPGDEQRSLLEVLRLRAGASSVKDGCAPQGQCGCCTVLVDGQPRVACVTATRRVLGRTVTTVDGLPPATRQAWADALTAAGGSQCGFCTPGILVRLAALADPTPPRVEEALLAHLCRCTGWRTVLEAAAAAAAAGLATSGPPAGSRQGGRDLGAAAARAGLEAGTGQRVGPDVALGHGGFAADTAPAGALVAVLDGEGEWVVGATAAEAREAAGRVQGRRTTLPIRWPLEPPPGPWDLVLATTWVEPAYLEPDCSWCEPGGEPATPLANGGAFGGKLGSPVAAAARRLADEHGRAVVASWTREDVVRLGPKRPPLGIGARADGTGHVRVARTPGIAAAIARAAPGWEVEEVDVPGPPTSSALRGAGWAEAAAVVAALAAGDDGRIEVSAPGGAWAAAIVTPSAVQVEVACGPPLDEVVLRSWCVGATHQALGWVWSEGLAVDPDGEVHDLTIRSFGILRARDTPPVTVAIRTDRGPSRPVPGSDAVFAAVAAAAWRAEGLPGRWPSRR